MPLITPDTSQAGNIEPGTYPIEIVVAEPTKSKEKGTPMIKLTVKTQYNGAERTRVTNVMTSGPGSYSFDQLLRAVKLADVADAIKVPGANVQFDTDQLLGRSCNAVFDLEMYNGQERDQIKSFLPL